MARIQRMPTQIPGCSSDIEDVPTTFWTGWSGLPKTPHPLRRWAAVPSRLAVGASWPAGSDWTAVVISGSSWGLLRSMLADARIGRPKTGAFLAQHTSLEHVADAERLK
jgi:hypothetical protein